MVGNGGLDVWLSSWVVFELIEGVTVLICVFGLVMLHSTEGPFVRVRFV